MSAGELDPITLEVVRNKLDDIADEMEITLLKSSHSTVVKEALDASAASSLIFARLVQRVTAARNRSRCSPYHPTRWQASYVTCR